MDCVKHIYKRNGLRGLFLGFNSTVCREMPSFGLYFFCYEGIKRELMRRQVNDHTAMLTAGGCAGVLSWTMAYPIDGKCLCLPEHEASRFCVVNAFLCVSWIVIKSSIQTLPEDAKPHEKRMAFQIRRLYALGGHRIFFNGLSTAVVRAFPVNAVTFYFYEMTSDALKTRLLERD